MIRWTVYSRPECGLCETLQIELAALLGPAEAARVEVIDITGDAALERKYGTRIPVLLADGEFVCAYRLDEDRVRGAMGYNPPPFTQPPA